MPTLTIFDFEKNSTLDNWNIVDDVVMGGRSSGRFSLNKDGHGSYQGSISIENNGGFSSLRYRFDKVSTKSYTTILLRVRGDGKSYQFRIKINSTDSHSYIATFDTTSVWETIEIPLHKMYPAFRGRTLNIPNYADEGIEEIAFLFGNKKTESFKLLIDSIVLQ